MESLSREQVRNIDRCAIGTVGLPGVVLMENAGRNAADAIEQFLDGTAGRSIAVVAGSGNNGGDGYVIARHLAMRGARVEAIRDGADMSFRIGVPDFQKQFSEAALKKSFNNAEVRTKEGKLIRAAGSDMFPFDYDVVLPEKSADQLRAELGGVTPAGSKAEVDAEWNEEEQPATEPAKAEAATTDEDELAGMVGNDEQPAARQAAPQAKPTTKAYDDPDDEIPFN